jgi:hypothetical protein
VLAVSSQQKGSVENLVGFVKSSVFKVRRFHDEEDLRQQLHDWHREVNQLLEDWKGTFSIIHAAGVTFSAASSLLCRSAPKPRPDGKFHRVAGSPGRSPSHPQQLCSNRLCGKVGLEVQLALERFRIDQMAI